MTIGILVIPTISTILVEPTSDPTASAAAYAAMGLTKSTRVITAESDSATEYRFTIDVTADANFKKLFAMNKCLVRFYAAGTEIPFFASGRTNNYSPGAAFLEMTVLEVTANDLQPAFPARASSDIIVRRYYCLNFDEASIETPMVSLIESYHEEDELRAKLDFIGHPTTKTGHDLALEYFARFKTDSSLFILANGGDEIATLKENSSGSAPVYGLTLFFGTGAELDSLSWNADDSVKTYFQYYQRLRNDSFLSPVSLAGHPMISRILGLTQDECRVDFVDVEAEPEVDKYLSNALSLDPDVHPNVLVVPTTKTASKNGQTFPSSSGEVQLYVYNPDAVDLVVTSSDSSLLSIDGAAESNVSSTIFVTLKALTSATGSATLYVRRRSDRTVFRSLTVQFLDVHVVPIKFFKLHNAAFEGDVDDIAALIEEVNAILGPQANVYVYSADVDASNQPVTGEITVPDSLEWDVYVYAGTPPSAASADWSTLAAAISTGYRYSYCFIWNLRNYPGAANDAHAATQAQYSTTSGDPVAIITVDDRLARVPSQVVAHEIGHGLTDWKYVDRNGAATDSEKVKHFDHQGLVVSNSSEGDHRLARNIMNTDTPGQGEYNLTFTQGQILNDCAKEVGE